MIEKNCLIFHIFVCALLVWKSVKPDYDKFPSNLFFCLSPTPVHTSAPKNCFYHAPNDYNNDSDRFRRTINREQRTVWRLNIEFSKRPICYSIDTRMWTVFSDLFMEIYLLILFCATKTIRVRRKKLEFSFPMTPSVRLSVNLDVWRKKNRSKVSNFFPSITNSLLVDRLICTIMSHRESVCVCKTILMARLFRVCWQRPL